MSATLNSADVPEVSVTDLLVPMRKLIAKGRGLALLTGVSEDDLRALETEIWAHFSAEPQVRLAVALRFRALLDVFAGRRLKDLFLNQGFKLIARAINEASSQRLNTRYGFNPQKFVAALATPPSAARPAVRETREFALAA